MFNVMTFWVGIFKLLLPVQRTENARAATLGDVRFPRSNEGGPVTVIWGTVRLRGPNTLWYGDFRVQPIKEKVKTGLFSSKRVTTGYKYYFGMDLALCLGPNVTLKAVWAGKYLAWAGSLSTEAAFSINAPELFGGEKQRGGLQGTCVFYPGSFTQNRNGYLAAVLDPNISRYGGVSHIVFQAFYFGTTTSLEPFNFEVQRLTDAVLPGRGIMPNGLDLNPVEVLHDCFTQKWGRLGIAASALDTDSWQAAAQTLYDEGNGMSLKLESPNSGKQLAEEVLRQIDGVMFQDPQTSKVVLKLLRNDYDVDDLPVFDMSDVLEIQDWTKTTWESTVNQCRVKFTSRQRAYEESVAVAQDFANINFQTKIRSTEISYPGVTETGLASRLAYNALSVYGVPLYKCSMTTKRRGANLRPGDVFILEWPPFGIRVVMRVQNVDLGDLTDGKAKIECIQDVYAVNNVQIVPSEPSGWEPIDLTPRQISDYAVFGGPYFFVQDDDQMKAWLPENYGETVQVALMMTLARSPGAGSISYDSLTTYVDPLWIDEEDIYTTGDDELYTASALVHTAYSREVAFTTAHDTTVGLIVKSLDDPSILSVHASRNDGRDGSHLIYANGEFMSYTAFTANVDGTYTLHGISRRILDSQPVNHAVNSVVYFIRRGEGLSAMFNNEAAVKLLDNTPTGTFPSESATSIPVNANNRTYRPAPVGWVTVNGRRDTDPLFYGESMIVGWRPRNRLRAELVWFDDANDTPESNVSHSVHYNDAVLTDDWSLLVTAGVGETQTAPVAVPAGPFITPGVLELAAHCSRPGGAEWAAAIAHTVRVRVYEDDFAEESNFEAGIIPIELADAATWGTVNVGSFPDQTRSNCLVSLAAVTEPHVYEFEFDITTTRTGGNFTLRYKLGSVSNTDVFEVFVDSNPTPVISRSGAMPTFVNGVAELSVGTHTMKIRFTGNTAGNRAYISNVRWD